MFNPFTSSELFLIVALPRLSMDWFMAPMRRAARAAGGQDQSSPSRVVVQWGRERLHIDLPHEPKPTLGMLKSKLAAITSIPLSQIKLVYKGLVLRDDKTLLESYGIQNGDMLALVGTKGGVEPDRVGAKQREAKAARKEEEDTSEAGMIKRIRATVNKTREELLGDVEGFEKSVRYLNRDEKKGTVAGTEGASRETGRSDESRRRDRSRSPSASSPNSAAVPVTSTGAPAPQATASIAAHRQRRNSTASNASTAASTVSEQPPLAPSALPKAHRRLSELLLRSLLALDAINLSPGADEVRKERKAGVKEIQGWLDRVDKAWNDARGKPGVTED